MKGTTMHTLYTIGYSGWKPEQLACVISSLNAMLVDIRFSPRSRVPQWNGGRLATLVGPESYLHLKALGNANYKNGGPVELVAVHAGIASVADILCTRPVVLLCGCKDHATCHRTNAAEAIAEALGCEVQHLYPTTPTPTSSATPPTQMRQMQMF